jgi:MFS family permease
VRLNEAAPGKSSLWRNAAFLRLVSATAVSDFGTEISNLALPLTAIGILGAGPLEVGILTAAGFLPTSLFGLPAGAWVDRVRRRPLLIASDLLRGAALASVPLAFLGGGLTMLQLYGVSFIVGSLSILFDVARQSYLPAVVDRAQLALANGRLQLAEQGAAVGGPGAAGLLIAAAGAPLTVAVDAASYFASAALLAGIRLPEAERPPAAAQSLRRAIAEGIGLVLRDRYLRPIAIAGSLVSFFGRMLWAILILYLVRDARLSPAQIGLVLSVAGAGFVVGALAAPSLVRSLGLGRAAAGAIIVAAVGLAVIGLAPPGSAALSAGAGLFVYGAAAVVWQVAVTTLRQSLTAPELLGRVTATMRVISSAPIPLAALSGGAIAVAIGLRPTVLAAGVAAVVVALPILLSALPRLGDSPQPG